MTYTPLTYKRYLLLSGVTLTLALGSVAYAISAGLTLPWRDSAGIDVDENVSSGFAVPLGTSREITVRGECVKVTTTTANIFIPTLTVEEWNRFKASVGNVGTNLTNCIPTIPNA